MIPMERLAGLINQAAEEMRAQGIEIDETELAAALRRFTLAEDDLRKGKLADVSLTGDAFGTGSEQGQRLLHHHEVAAGVMGRTTQVVAADIATYKQGINRFKAHVTDTEEGLVASLNSGIAALQQSSSSTRSDAAKQAAIDEVAGQGGGA